MIEPSLDHHLPRDRFQPFRPRQKMNSAREFVADDYDLVPNVRNDVVIRGQVRLISINHDQRVKLDPTLAPLDQRVFKTDVMVTTRNSLIMTISS